MLKLEDLQKEMQAGFAGIHAEITSMRHDLKTKFAVLNSRIDDLRTDTHLQTEAIRRDMREFYVTIADHDNRLDKLQSGEGS